MDFLEPLEEFKQEGIKIFHNEKEQMELWDEEPAPDKLTKQPQNDPPEVFVKAELKDECVVGESNIQQTDGNSDSDSDLELSKLKKLIKSKKNDKAQEYKSFVIKSYTSTGVKEELIDDLITIFKENNLKFERLKFQQQIFEHILENSEQVKLKELQAQYMAQLHQAANVETFSCSFCSYQTINMTTLRGHLLVIHNKNLEQKKYKCNICNFEDYHKVNMTLHMKLHQTSHEKITHKCEQCKYIAPSQRALKNHLKKHSQGVVSKCDLCTFQVIKGSLKKHMMTHKIAPNKYKCYKCEFEVAHKIKLAKHLLDVHQIENECIQNIKKYKCPFCNYSTDQKNRLKGHSLLHKNPDEIEYFSCTSCPFKTKFKKSLSNHEVTHEDPSKRVKTKMCEICSYKCSKPSDLRKHLLTHKSLSELSESEIFSCTECSYKTKNKDHLKDHLLIHGAPQFHCDICGYQARRKQNYQHHLLLHKKSSEICIYECPYCPYKSRQKEGYKHHMKVGDHSGKNLKHIPHRFRVENTDREDFDPKAVRFGPPKKYPKYPKKNKSEGPDEKTNSSARHEQPPINTFNVASDIFLNFINNQ